MGDDRLESWKEIAAYLGREVRTVQLWEKSEGLPVHRHQHARQGSVYAFKPELDAWREKRKNAPASPKTNHLWRILPAAGILLAISIGAFAFRGARPPDSGVPSSVAVLPF